MRQRGPAVYVALAPDPRGTLAPMRTALAAALCAGLTVVAPAAADAKTKKLRFPTAQAVTDQVSSGLADGMMASSTDAVFVETGWTYAPRRSCARRTRLKITCEGNAY